MCKGCVNIEIKTQSFGLFGIIKMKNKNCNCPCTKNMLTPFIRAFKCSRCKHTVERKQGIAAK